MYAERMILSGSLQKYSRTYLWVWGIWETDCRKSRNFSERQKGFRDGLSCSTPQKNEETRENAITQPRSHSTFFL